MGPSIGWITLPGTTELTISTAGTTQLLIGVSLVKVNVAGLVTVVLPSAIHPAVPAGVLPGEFGDIPITIVDIGGNAQAFNITIQPLSGAENIMGLASVAITNNYGGYILNPSSTLKGWNSTQ
jgi:hypothetical protein